MLVTLGSLDRTMPKNKKKAALLSKSRLKQEIIAVAKHRAKQQFVQETIFEEEQQFNNSMKARDSGTLNVTQLQASSSPRNVQLSMSFISPSQANLAEPKDSGLHGTSLLDSRESFSDGDEDDQMYNEDEYEQPEL